MKECRSEEIRNCCFHPEAALVGVCPVCLNEKLIFLASKQGSCRSRRRSRSGSFTFRSTPPSISFLKIFAFTNFLRRLQFRHSRPEYTDLVASPSHDDSGDSFISMKFEENGVPSWEKKKNPKEEYASKEKNTPKTLTEVVKTHAPLRWQNRIGHVFQLIRSKRSSKANMFHVNNKPDGVKLSKLAFVP